jgi:hypothetical protein
MKLDFSRAVFGAVLIAAFAGVVHAGHSGVASD